MFYNIPALCKRPLLIINFLDKIYFYLYVVHKFQGYINYFLCSGVRFFFSLRGSLGVINFNGQKLNLIYSNSYKMVNTQ